MLVLRGSGDDAFIGGADIGEMARLNPTTATSFITQLAGLCDAVAAMPVPVIARIAGWCLRGGLEVALACDLRICDAGAMFGMPEVRIGIPSVIHAALLLRLIGQARASEMLLCCDNFGAAQAEARGLAHELCPSGELDAHVQQRAAALAALPPQALRQQKRLLRHWQTVPLAQAITDSVGEFALAYTTGEPQALMGDFMARKTSRRRRRQPAAVDCEAGRPSRAGQMARSTTRVGAPLQRRRPSPVRGRRTRAPHTGAAHRRRTQAPAGLSRRRVQPSLGRCDNSNRDRQAGITSCLVGAHTPARLSRAAPPRATRWPLPMRDRRNLGGLSCSISVPASAAC